MLSKYLLLNQKVINPSVTSAVANVNVQLMFLASVVANGAFQCHFGSLYYNTPTPSPSKIISLQIYTDLKNGPESWKKV